jgi:hypothetical protein
VRTVFVIAARAFGRLAGQATSIFAGVVFLAVAGALFANGLFSAEGTAVSPSSVWALAAANVLPLGMHTKIVWKCNLRMLENFMNQRLCGRDYHEIHRLAYELKKALGALDEEWKWISDNLFVPKCEKTGYCIEKKSCGRKPQK